MFIKFFNRAFFVYSLCSLGFLLGFSGLVFAEDFIKPSNPYTSVYNIPKESKKFAGREIDLSRFRPAFINSNPDSDTLSFYNYMHEDKYWEAHLSKTAVIESLYVHVVRFEVVSGVTAAHVQLRAKLLKGSEVVLKNESEEKLVNDIVISFEAARPAGESYNFFVGTEDNYLLSGRIASGSQRLSEYGEGYFTEQYEIDFSSDEALKLVLDGIQMSHEEGLSGFYNSLKPNCVTKVFDLIDAILVERGLKKPDPFLTVISNDPVAGPTIFALEERGILKERKANLRDEIEKGITQAPAKVVGEQSIDLLPTIEGYPYSLVMLLPKKLQESTEFKEAKKTAYELVPKFMQSFVSTLMLNEAGKSTSLLRAFRGLGEEMKKGLEQMNQELGEPDTSFALYFAPWKQSNGREVDVIQELGVDAKLPIKTFEADLNFDNFNDIHISLNDALSAQAMADINFGPMGMVIHISLIKGEVSMSFQAVGHLGDFEKEMDISNDKVNISKFVVPKKTNVFNEPVAVLNLSQRLEEDLPKMRIDFGSFGGLSMRADRPQNEGKFIIHTREGDKVRGYSAPSMRGTAASISLVDVWMDIFSMEFDLESFRVSDMDVRVSSGIFGLKTAILKDVESDPEVNALFTDAVNTELQTRVSDVSSSPGLSLFEELYANNQSGVVSGFNSGNSSNTYKSCSHALEPELSSLD